ncbi:MAG: DUF5372 family protein [Acidimicrobiales bacterium]
MTHPFHPWCGREFVFVAVRHTWGEDRVFFFADDGTQKSLPRAWTDAADVDVFVALAAGRCPFRIVDLLVLAEIVDGLRVAGAVSEISPQM